MPRNRTSSSPAKGSWKLIAIAAALAVGPLLVGCDNAAGKADKKIMEGVSSVSPATTPEQAAKNVATLEALTKEADASTASKSLAKAALARAELQSAMQIAASVQEQELLVARKIWEMEQVAGQIQQAKIVIDAASRRNPSEALAQPVMGEKVIIDDLKSKASDARGGNGGQAWVKDDKSPLDSVAQSQAKIDGLTKDLEKLQTSIAEMKDHREHLNVDAGATLQQSQAAKGDESEKLFIKAADLQKQSAMMGIQIEGSSAGLMPLNQDLKAAQEHLKVVTAAATSFDTAAQTYTDNYAKISEQIASMKASATAMLSGDKDSIKSKAIELNTLTAAADSDRSHAVEQFKAAISHYGDAVTTSEKVKSEAKHDTTPGTADALLIKQLNDATEASSLRLRQAEASADLAALQSAYALLLTRRATVVASVTAAATPMALSIPAEVADAKTDDQLKEARTAATEAYTSADAGLENISSGSGSAKTKTDALIARAIVNAGWSQLATSSGDTESARKHLEDARGYQKSAADEPNGEVIPPYLMVLTDTVPVADVSKMPTTAPAKVAAPDAAPTTDPTPPAGAGNGVFSAPQ